MALKQWVLHSAESAIMAETSLESREGDPSLARGIHPLVGHKAENFRSSTKSAETIIWAPNLAPFAAAFCSHARHRSNSESLPSLLTSKSQVALSIPIPC
jgi:hypothetical protein